MYVFKRNLLAKFKYILLHNTVDWENGSAKEHKNNIEAVIKLTECLNILFAFFLQQRLK